jgi:hypothetical protein
MFSHDNKYGRQKGAKIGITVQREISGITKLHQFKGKLIRRTYITSITCLVHF